MSQKWEKNKSKVCLVKSSLIIPVTQCLIASPFRSMEQLLLVIEQKFLKIEMDYYSKYLMDMIDIYKHNINIFINDMW